MKALKKMKIKTKIWGLFVACILVTSFVSIAVVVYSNKKATLNHIGEMTTQTLHAIDNNMELMIDHVNQDTYAVFWSKMFQDTLEEVSKGNLTVETRTDLQDCLINIMLAGDYISSILFYDNLGNSFSCNREEVVLKKEIPVEEAYWYNEVMEMDGDWIFETDGGGMVSYKSQNRNILSMIKVIKKKTDYSKLGILMVNIDEKTIRNIFSSVGGNLNSNFYVMLNGELIFGPEDEKKYQASKEIIGELTENETRIDRNSQTPMVYKKIFSALPGWSIVGEIPLDSLSVSISYFQTVGVLGFNILLLVLCWLYISRALSRPIQKMEEQMLYSDSIPENMVIEEECEDEISNLKRAYNALLNSIRELLERTRKEEEIIRKNELDLILEQISPHFLYNTLDTISALTLIGDQDKSFQMTQALGRFYRNSLNSGRQMLSLREELDIIKNYMTIINIRYDDKISITYEVAEDLLDVLILKLILQPLVENAVHHGMRQKDGPGELRIGVQALDKEMLEVSVWDNGVGIPEERIGKILNGEYRTKKSGFGLYSVKQRVELFYGITDAVCIRSDLGNWTEIKVRFPRRDEE
ncbi:sensor histidine kinase [Ruminococcus sp. 5_1_39BFAA]|uniref:sensor histidine kinase n=1 Tax=Ruminococcus sp. 5_1_39BFAA TaxID=457412 RepID=UPI0035631349